MAQTHDVSVDGSVVTKSYVSWSRDEPLREWAALQVISASAPDLVPIPLRISPAPSVCMSLVPGRPLAGVLTAVQLDGLEVALRQLWSIPADGLAPICSSAFVDRVREAVSSFRGSGIVAEAQAAAADWLGGSEIDRLFEPWRL